MSVLRSSPGTFEYLAVASALSVVLGHPGLRTMGQDRTIIVEAPEHESGVSPRLPDPVAHWRFEEEENLFVLDRMGRAQYGRSTRSVTRAPGVVGQAAVLNGAGSYITIPDHPRFHFTTAMTVAGWIKPGKGSGNLLSKWYTYDSYGLSWDGVAYRFVVAFPVGGQWGTPVGVQAAGTTDQWTHVAGVYDGKAVLLYLNGKLAQSLEVAAVASIRQSKEFTETGKAPTHLQDSNVPIYLGERPNGSAFQAAIDEMRLYDFALSQEQIAALAGDRLPPPWSRGRPLLAETPLPESPVNAAENEPKVDPQTTVITQSTVLDPSQPYGRLVIKSSNITIDGRGAKIWGSRAKEPQGFKQAGISAKGVSHVTLKNVLVGGWQVGLSVQDGTGWVVENCDFSGNFDDPQRARLTFFEPLPSLTATSEPPPVAQPPAPGVPEQIPESLFGPRLPPKSSSVLLPRLRCSAADLFGLPIPGSAVPKVPPSAPSKPRASPAPAADDLDLAVTGAIVFRRVHKSTLRKNKANQVWSGCLLIESDDNTLVDNDFSHASYTGLCLRQASRNRVERNVLSHAGSGAENSFGTLGPACLILEQGCNENQLVENDCGHGNNGISLRAENGRPNAGNLLEKNECSYARQVCLSISDSPGTAIRGNKANQGSAGICVTSSDEVVISANEACDNGKDCTGRHGTRDVRHPGIELIGPCRHLILRQNECLRNVGPGITVNSPSAPPAAVEGSEPAARPASIVHAIVDQNTLADNGLGFRISDAEWVDLGANSVRGNRLGNLHIVQGAADISLNASNPQASRAPTAVLKAPAFAKIGQKVMLDASASSDPAGLPLQYRWNRTDLYNTQESRWETVFSTAGFYRVALTVTNGTLSDLAWQDIRVSSEGPELGTEGQAADWDWCDPDSAVRFSDDRETRIVGESSLLAAIRPSGASPIQLLYPASRKAGVAVESKGQLVLWMRSDRTLADPVVTLHETPEKFRVCVPIYSSTSHTARGTAGWRCLTIPVAGNSQWSVEGPCPTVLNYLTINFAGSAKQPLKVWIDGLGLTRPASVNP